jgi:predicted Fe-Mo cluster-binding NifX family protein
MWGRLKEMVKITVICMPTIDESGLLSDISTHFGKTTYFTFIRLENGEIKNINVTEILGKHKGGSKTPSEIIIDSGADVMICGNLGSKAVSMLRGGGMEIFSGASGKVKDILKEWKMGNLAAADENSCNEKGC